MRHDQLRKELEIITLLSQNRSYTIDEICEKTGVSRRTMYYYFDFFRSAGFEVEKHDQYFSLSRNSEFFNTLFEILQFTFDEAVIIRNLLESSTMRNDKMKAVLRKLENFYDFESSENDASVQRVTRSMQRVREAIKKRRLMKIIGYSSANSHSVKDRIVEPFLFMNNCNDVRCYEIESGKNKTFRLSRMQGVEVLEEPWSHVEEHRKMYTDLFNFSSEERMIVTLHLGQLSHSLMLEEYPLSAPCFAEMGNNKWLFRTEVCSYLGIGRFVLGLYDDIEVIGDEGFKEYLKGKIKGLAGALD